MMEAQHICYTSGLEDVNETWHSARLHWKVPGRSFVRLPAAFYFVVVSYLSVKRRVQIKLQNVSQLGYFGGKV